MHQRHIPALTDKYLESIASNPLLLIYQCLRPADVLQQSSQLGKTETNAIRFDPRKLCCTLLPTPRRVHG